MVKNKVPSAREFLEKRLGYGSNDVEYQMREFAKLHVKAALDAARENAQVTDKLDSDNSEDWIDKDSILKAYPESNIK